MSWPIGIGATFQGVYDLYSKGPAPLRGREDQGGSQRFADRDLADPRLEQEIGEDAAVSCGRTSI
jgi:peptide chain release factor 3